MSAKVWIEAFRLRTLFLSLSCILMGALLASFYHMHDVRITLLALLTALFLQVLSNLANDYGDSIHGADHSGRKGPSRAVQSGKISKASMKRGIVVCSALAVLSGVCLLFVAYDTLGLVPVVVMFVMGLLAVAAAIAYTNGKRPYGYAGLGDISVYLFFGLLAVCGTCYLHTGDLYPATLLPASSMGLFATAVLNLNNMRDIDSDKQAGKLSIPVRLGFSRAKIYHLLLIGIAWIGLVVFALMAGLSGWQYLFLAASPLFIFHLYRVFTTVEKHALDSFLKQLSLSTFLLVLLFAAGLFLA